MLFTEADIETTMERIETIKFHEEKIINGIKFWCYHAGHVLGRVENFDLNIVRACSRLFALSKTIIFVSGFVFNVWNF